MTNKVFEMKIKIDRSAFDLTKEKVVLKWRRCNETSMEGSTKMDMERIVLSYYIILLLLPEYMQDGMHVRFFT